MHRSELFAVVPAERQEARMPDVEQMMKRQAILAGFGEFALRSDDLDAVLQEACRLVADALGTKRAKILELEDEGRSFFVRAGIGWGSGVVGSLRLPMSEHTSESYSLRRSEPVVTRDLTEEDRFDVPEFMKEGRVRALVNTPVLLPGGKPFGLLQVDDTEPRDFGDDDIQFLRTYTAILGPVIDRLLTAAALTRSEKRFRSIVEAVRDYAIFVTDPQDRITDWLPGAASVFGWSAEEAAGQPGAILYTPEDRAADIPRREIEAALRDGTAPDVRWHLHKDGRRVFIEGTVTALREADGRVRGFQKIGKDVTAQHLAEMALRDSEERFQLFGQASTDILWIRDAHTLHWVYLTPAFEAIYGRSRKEALDSPGLKGWLDCIVPEDRDLASASVAAVQAGGTAEFEYRIRRPDGEIRWVRNTDFPLRGPQQEVRWIGGIGQDITEEKQAADQMETMVHELQHRTRNLLGVVRSLAGQVIAGSSTLEEFRAEFWDQLETLSRVQGLLSRSDTEPITLDALVWLELRALGAEAMGDRISVSGPPVRLRASIVQMLALGLHELATNARKHGALAGEKGQVSVSWQIVGGDRPSVELHWREAGTEPNPAPGHADGFGRTLLERGLPYSVGGTARLDMTQDGIGYQLSMPVKRAVKED